jgi:hypothetical protein
LKVTFNCAAVQSGLWVGYTVPMMSNWNRQEVLEVLGDAAGMAVLAVLGYALTVIAFCF